MTTLDDRLARLEARNAISELRSRYCWYTARGLREAVTELFTEDALFENSRSEDGGTVIIRGRAALHAFFGPMKPARRIPLVMNEVIAISGASASGTCAMISVGEDGFCGHYVDDFRLVEGQWLFSRRQFFPYWPQFKPSPERHDP